MTDTTTVPVAGPAARAAIVREMSRLIATHGWNEHDCRLDATGTAGISIVGAFNRACGSDTVWPPDEFTDDQLAVWEALFTTELLGSNVHLIWSRRTRTTAEIVAALDALAVGFDGATT